MSDILETSDIKRVHIAREQQIIVTKVECLWQMGRISRAGVETFALNLLSFPVEDESRLLYYIEED